MCIYISILLFFFIFSITANTHESVPLKRHEFVTRGGRAAPPNLPPAPTGPSPPVPTAAAAPEPKAASAAAKVKFVSVCEFKQAKWVWRRNGFQQ